MSPKTAVITLVIIIITGGLFIFYLSVMNQGVGTEMVDFSQFKNQGKDSGEKKVFPEKNPIATMVVEEDNTIKKSQEELEEEVEEIREEAKDRPYTKEEEEKIRNIKYDFQK